MVSSRSCVRWLVLIVVLVGGTLSPSVYAAPADVVVSDDPNFAVPAGDAATVLAFIEKLAAPQQQFASEAELHAYLENVAPALSEAADRVLAGEATDRQLADAIEWKVESFRIREKLGDEAAGKQTDEFLASLDFPERPAVEQAVEGIRRHRAEMLAQMELIAKLRSWPRLTPAQRADATEWLIDAVKSGGATGSHANMLAMFSDALSDTQDTELVKKALRELLPLLQASHNPGVAQRLPLLEGINRRLNLPGNKLELSGTLLDGQKLDWAAYRGKVVLVDFWATWCGPCRAEVPNVLENYLKYHDKGFDVVGISLDEKRSDAEDYVAQTNIPWPSLFHETSDESGWQNPMAVKYGINSIPTAILVDQEGNVVSMQARGPRLGAALEKLLGRPEATRSSRVNDAGVLDRTAQSESK